MQKLGTFSPPLTGSSKELTSSTYPSQASAGYAAERARLLFGQYRRGDANDPDVYVAAITAVLACYSEAIIQEVTDPRTGISATAKFAAFMPNPGEVKLHCDELAKLPPLHAWSNQYEARTKRQLEERAEREASGPRQVPQRMVDDLIKNGLWKQDKGYTQQARDADEAKLERYRQAALKTTTPPTTTENTSEPATT